MDSEQEDVDKMTELINQQKTTNEHGYQLEFQEFVSYKVEYSDDEYYEEDIIDEEEDYKHEPNNDIVTTNTEFPAHVTLTEEERSIVDSCTDPELTQILILNRKKNMQLIQLHKKMKDMVTECEQAMEEKLAALKNIESKQSTVQPHTWKLAAPYFKDKKFFASPLNEDATKKRARNELSIYDLHLSRKWTPIEFDRLFNAIRCNYNLNRQGDIIRRIRLLKEETDEGDDKCKISEIIQLEEELKDIKKHEKIPPRNSNEFIDWYKVSETFLKDKHTASECQSVWHILVHPDLNKSEWTEEENTNLEQIAKEYSYQNWDEIATELGTKRTGFTTCLHYFSKLCDKFKKSKFTPDEDNFLLEVVSCYKVGSYIPWNKVVCHFNNRSRHQLYHRYMYFLSQNHVKKGKFTEAEDILLMVLVNKFGRNFKKCAQYMPHRSQIQLKCRYNSNLKRNIKKGTFTEEDDKIIYEFVQKHGTKSWSPLTETLQRCSAQIRQRYKLIKTFLSTNPNASLSDIPKRRHRIDKLGEEQYNFLSYMADQYRNINYIPTISMIEESLQAELRTPTPERPLQHKNRKNTFKQNPKKVNVKNIDDLLTDFFSSTMRLKEPNTVTEVNLAEACSNVEMVLSQLGAQLNIPEGFEYNVHLDGVDVDILERISKKRIVPDQYKKPDKLIPPNINTLVGLRSLIIKHKDYKTQQKNKNAPSTSRVGDTQQNLLKLDETFRKDILFHRELFTRRFNALFNWSAILSLEKPNHIDFPKETNPSDTTAAAATAKTYVRNPDNQPVVKKRKIDVSALTSISQRSQLNGSLKLVDKCVLERLMKNKQKVNIIRIETTTGADGIAKPILKQNFPEKQMANSISTAASSANIDALEDNLSDDKHEYINNRDDVQKLNVMLKSEACNDTTYSSEEFQAIKGDVQLLKEILHYEKIKIEPSPDNF